MKWRTRKLLSLVVGDRSLAAAEVHVRGGTIQDVRSVTWPYPEGTAIGESLGKALRQFLRDSRFISRTAVIGVPTRWLLSKEKTTPPAEPAQLAGLLRLEAEQDFHCAGELEMDYAEPASTTAAGKRLLVIAMPSEKMAALKKMAATAGLKLISITPAVLPLSDTVDASEFIGIWLGREGAEVIVRQNGAVRVCRHITLSANSATPSDDEALQLTAGVVGEIRRMLALMPGGIAQETSRAVWSDGLLPESVVDAVCKELKAECHDRSSAAVALAYACAGGKRLSADFLHSHLSMAGQPQRRRRFAFSSAAVAAALLAGAAVIAHFYARERDVRELRAKISAMQPEIDAASSVVERVRYLRDWRGAVPRLLECLRELSAAFPLEGRVWVLSMAFRDDMRGIISGKATDNKAVLDLLGEIRKSSAFEDVKLLYVHEAGGDSTEVAYSISIRCTGVPPAATVAASQAITNDGSRQ